MFLAVGQAVEQLAAELGYLMLNLDLRATQTAAIQIYEAQGFERWGTNPAYALVEGKFIEGHYYSKQLRELTKAKKSKNRKKPAK